MRKRTWLLGVLAFALAMLVVLPVNWIGSLLPAGMQCADWGGSVWRGSCRGFSMTQAGSAPLQIDAVSWKVHPLALFTLKLRADFSLTYAQGDAGGQVDISAGGRLSLREVTAHAVLDRRMLGALPAGWNGQLEVAGLTAATQGQQLTSLQGTLRVRDVGNGRGAAMGGYELVFPPAASAPFTGQLRDTGGPYEVAASLQLSPDRSWTLEGTVAVRPGTDPALDRQLDLLGAPDATGRRRLSAAGTFN
jgi:hypothetical protein